jgi:hypothetical protein
MLSITSAPSEGCGIEIALAFNDVPRPNARAAPNIFFESLIFFFIFLVSPYYNIQPPEGS